MSDVSESSHVWEPRLDISIILRVTTVDDDLPVPPTLMNLRSRTLEDEFLKLQLIELNFEVSQGYIYHLARVWSKMSCNIQHY